GNQILGIALGATTYKLKFGHHGANHPVKDFEGNRISITSQNHGFCVDVNSLNLDEVEVIHTNLNDQSIEGIRHKKYPAFSIQYHPEAAPGPRDAKYLFEQFIQMIETTKNKG
ncbi:MAG: carbamoyl phosphate synthase small subunit, partial [Candidatus Omnitrophica bacterium]|nr:carbamoyl phosphate synthase small subunit [Candidatus Omnitrophota bacterium]